jgi:hypothetical protein
MKRIGCIGLGLRTMVSGAALSASLIVPCVAMGADAAPAGPAAAVPTSAPPVAAPAVAPVPVDPATQARADALFAAGKQLRDAGAYEDACSKFSQTAELAPGIGVSMYLADCYQRMGRTANAWSEFRKAEQMARERNDSRVDVAKGRADALEAKLAHLTLGVADAAKHPGLTITVDGMVVQADYWNAPLPSDPGTRAIRIDEPGQSSRTMSVQLAEGANVTAPVYTPAAAPAPAAPIAAPAAAVEPTPDKGPSSSGNNVRNYMGLGLIGAGTVGVAVGAGLLDLENRSIVKGHKSSNAGTFAGVAFALAGAAYVSAVVVYLTAPKNPSTALTLSAGPIAAGGGAVLQGGF